MNNQYSVQEALAFIEESHAKHVSDMLVAKTLLKFVLSAAKDQDCNLGKNMIEQITAFLDSQK